MAVQFTRVPETVVTRRRRGWSQRRIARELGIDRGSVARYLQGGLAAKPAIAPPGSGGIEAGAKPAISPIGSDTSSHAGCAGLGGDSRAAAEVRTIEASGGPGGACGVPAEAMVRGIVPCSRNPFPPGPPDAFADGLALDMVKASNRRAALPKPQGNR